MKYTIKQNEELKAKVQNMSTRELLKTISCPQVYPDGTVLPDGYRSAFFEGTTRDETKKFIDDYEKRNGYKLVVWSDMECGVGSDIEEFIKYPSMRALGVSGDENAAYQLGLYTADRCHEIGYTCSGSPVIDLFRETKLESTTRYLSDDPDEVIRMAGPYMRGMQEGGMAATLKHFPGVGAGFGDAHITYTENDKTLDQWKKEEGRIYEALIDQGAMCIMVSHMSFPAVDEIDLETGLYPPATLSKNQMTGLIKDYLGFDGVIMSDAVTMSGFSGYMNYYKACAQFIICGGDLWVYPRTEDKFLDTMEAMVESGELPRNILEDRAYRMECFYKEIVEKKPEKHACDNFDEVAASVVKNSIDVIRDRHNLVPQKLGKDSRIMVLDFSTVYSDTKPAEDFYRVVKASFPNAEYWDDPGAERIAAAAENEEFDLILCTICGSGSWGTNVVKPHGPKARNIMGGWTKLGTPVIFISFHMPNFHHQFKGMMDTVINTYGITEKTFEALMQKIFE